LAVAAVLRNELGRSDGFYETNPGFDGFEAFFGLGDGWSLAFARGSEGGLRCGGLVYWFGAAGLLAPGGFWESGDGVVPDTGVVLIFAGYF